MKQNAKTKCAVINMLEWVVKFGQKDPNRLFMAQIEKGIPNSFFLLSFNTTNTTRTLLGYSISSLSS